LFVAAFPPASVVSDLRKRLAESRDDGRARRAGRFTPADRWHITLLFIGEVDDSGRAGVERALERVPRAGKISLHLAGGGEFGRGRSAVLWAGVQGDLTALTDLHDAVADALGAEPRPFTPHLTVAYAGGGALRAALDGYVGPEWTVDEFALVRSHHPDGGGYETLNSWPLGG